MKTKLLLIIFIPLFIGCSVFKKKDTVIVEEDVIEDVDSNFQTYDEIFDIVENAPSYNGGMQAMQDFINANLKYPEKAKEAGISGKVFVKFIIEKDGSLANPTIVRGIGSGCDEEAIRVLKLMPKWNPGTHRNKAVRVRFRMPIEFILDKEKAEVDSELNYPPFEIAEPGQEEEEIFIVVQTPPSFVGGDSARMEFLKYNLRYPNMALERGIQGTVYITFVIEKDGSLSNPKILRGIGGGCDEEVIRIIKLMPKWNPGKQRGKAVRVQFNMPVKFTLKRVTK